MNKAELVSRITAVLKESDIRKPVSIKKHTLHISDDEGNRKDFVLKETDRNVLFTAADVRNILDAVLAVVLDTLRNGGEISLQGFGTFSLRYTKFGAKKDMETGESIEIKPRYVAKFSPGAEMKRCARTYSQTKDEEALLRSARKDRLSYMPDYMNGETDDGGDA